MCAHLICSLFIIMRCLDGICLQAQFCFICLTAEMFLYDVSQISYSFRTKGYYESVNALVGKFDELFIA